MKQMFSLLLDRSAKDSDRQKVRIANNTATSQTNMYYIKIFNLALHISVKLGGVPLILSIN